MHYESGNWPCTKGYTVQGKIAKHPKWTADMNVTREAEVILAPGAGGNRCFFRVHSDSPKITLYDQGRVLVHTLSSSSSSSGGDDQDGKSIGQVVDMDELNCVHFRAMSAESHAALAPAVAAGAGESAVEPGVPTPAAVPVVGRCRFTL